MLISKGADLNGRDDGWRKLTPLIYASSNGQREVVEFLISKGADVNARDEIGPR